MNKYVALLLVSMVALLPSCCVFQGSKAPTGPQLAAQIERETVAMVHWVGPLMDEDGSPVLDEDGDPVIGEVDPDTNPKAVLRAYCTGVWVTKDVFVTAEHCVDELGMSPKLRFLKQLGLKVENDPTGQEAFYSSFGDVRDEGDRQFRGSRHATVLAADAEHDLALVQATPTAVETIPEHPVAVLADAAAVGEDVHIVGHTIGQWWSYTRGWVGAIRKNADGPNDGKVDLLQISAPIWFGNSGGGAFNAHGELLGVCSFMKKAPNMAYYIDYNTVRRFMRREGLSR